LFEINKINNLIAKIFITFIILIFILTNIGQKLLNKFKYGNNNPKFESQDEYTNNQTLIKKINEYVSLCRNGTLINPIINLWNQNPKISVIIPVFNASKTIKPAIRSIQNQNMIEYEILLVDDFSSDNSLEIINKMMLEDKRIRLIKNKENKGILYSRSIGALNARGRYIMALDNDDLFLYGIFTKSYEEAKRNNLDIIEFSGFEILHDGYVDANKITIPIFLRYKEDNVVVKQPELSKFFYVKKNNTYSYDFKDVFVWGKLIKRKIYWKALRVLGKKVINYKVFLTEDKIFTIALFRVAKSFKFIGKYGIIRNWNPNSICNSWIEKKRERILTDFLLFAIVFYNLNKDTEEIRILVEDLKIRFEEYNLVLRGEKRLLLMELCDNMIKNKNILLPEKKILINLMNNNKNNQTNEIQYPM